MSSLTPFEAKNEMCSLIHTAWLGDTASVTVPIEYPDQPNFQKPDSGPWARVVIQHVNGGAGAIGKRLWDRVGLLTIEVYAEPNDGLSNAHTLAKILIDALEGQSTPGKVIFRNVRLNELGRTEAQEQVNVIAAFEYTEVK